MDTKVTINGMNHLWNLALARYSLSTGKLSERSAVQAGWQCCAGGMPARARVQPKKNNARRNIQSEDIQSEDIHSEDIHSEDIHSEDIHLEEHKGQHIRSRSTFSLQKQKHSRKRTIAQSLTHLWTHARSLKETPIAFVERREREGLFRKGRERVRDASRKIDPCRASQPRDSHQEFT